MNTTFKITTLSLLVSAAVSAQADTTTPTVVVTASRMAQTEDDALASVSVITRKDIEQSQAPTLVELLRTQSGIDIARNGGAGTDTSVFMRGTNSDHVLVLVDGVRAASATTGSFAWSSLNPAQIDHIEIVRGPRASLYGSDAIGGVIQIFTRKNKGVTAAIHAGSYNTRGVEAGIGVGEKVHFKLNASVVDSAGFSAAKTGAYAYNPDKDGYTNRSLTSGLDLPLFGTHKLALAGWYSKSDAEFDQGRTASINQTGTATLAGELTQRWSHRFRVGHTGDEAETRGDFPSWIATRRDSANWQHDLELSDHNQLLLGLDFVQDQGKNIDNSTHQLQFNNTTENRAAYVSSVNRYASFDSDLSVRHDNHSAFGSHTTGQIAIGKKLNDDQRAYISYGNAFKAPTLNQLYHPGYFGGFWGGNANLAPERSRTLEIGLNYLPRNSRERMKIALFQTRIDNLINYSGGTMLQATNINQASNRGMEIQYGYTGTVWAFNGNLTFQQPYDDSQHKELLRRAGEKFTVTVSRRLQSGGSLNGEWLRVGERKDIGNVTLPTYSLINLSAIYPLSNGLKLEGRIENLLNKDYELVSNYATPGRSGYITLRYQPEAK